MQQAYKFDARVGVAGRVELTLPVPEGTEIEVVVLAPADSEFSDLVLATRTSLDFWNNPQDDADWNHA